MLYCKRLLVVLVIGGLSLSLTAGTAGAATNKGDVQKSKSKGWQIAWGKEVNHLEYAKLVASMVSGTTGAYLEGLVVSSAKTLGKDVVKKAIKHKDQIYNTKKYKVQAGIATYNHWTMERNPLTGKKFKVSRPNTHQPYVRWKKK